MTPLRQRALHAAFNLLYGPLAMCHEAIGRALFGEAWHARRLVLLDQEATIGVTLDLGCGEGRLLSAMRSGASLRVGIEPSTVMARRARKRGTVVVRARAQQLPFGDRSVSLVVCSYPGPWVLDPLTWRELERVTQPGAEIRLLLGGTIERGPAARLRANVLRLGYGGSGGGELPAIGTPDIFGAYERRADRWGEAICWIGVRR